MTFLQEREVKIQIKIFMITKKNYDKHFYQLLIALSLFNWG